MSIKPDPHGTNEQMRAARGTLQPCTPTPDQLQEEWDKIRLGRRQAAQAEIDERSAKADARREAKAKKAKRAKRPKKKHKPRRVRERKKVARDGSIRVCSTEPKRRQNRRTRTSDTATGPEFAETADLDWEDQL